MSLIYFKKRIVISSFSFYFLFFVTSMQSQTWRASLYPSTWTPPTGVNYYTGSFIQDFSYAGYHYGVDQIPNITANVINVTQAPYNADKTGNADATNAIQQAINKAGNDGGGVVFLPAGTYKISPKSNNYCLLINKSNVVLRGNGKDQTFLYNSETNMRDKVVISVEGSGSSWKAKPSATSIANISNDLMGPTKTIPVDKPQLFNVGDLVVVKCDVTDAWNAEHKTPEWNTASYKNSLGGIQFLRYVKKVNSTAKTIEIDIPTRYALKMSDNAVVYKCQSNMINEVGIEDLAIGNKEIVTSPADWTEPNSTTELDNAADKDPSKGGYKTDNCWIIDVSKIMDSWIKNVSTYRPSSNTYRTQMLSNGIRLDLCKNVTLDNCYVGYAQYGGGGGNGYGFRIQSNDCLLKNCKSQFTRHGFVFSFMTTSGNVLHKCTDISSGKCTGNASSTAGLNTGSSGSDFHMWFSPSNLIDQMDFDDSYYSIVNRKGVGNDHSAVTAHSVIWNTTAKNSTAGYCVRSSQTKRGYVFGTSGATPGVNYKLSDPANLTNGATGVGPAFRYDPDGSVTSPQDVCEGINSGVNLQPQSLYLDQLQKRTSTLGIDDVEFLNASRISVYPNPVDDVLHIENLGGRSWILYDLYSRPIKEGSESEINVNDLSKGVYLIQTKSNSSSLKVLKK
jgi:hypothetical protein